MAEWGKVLVVGALGLYALQSCEGDPVTGAKIATGGAAVGAGVGVGVGVGAGAAGIAGGVRQGARERARGWVARPNGPSRPYTPGSTVPVVVEP